MPTVLLSSYFLVLSILALLGLYRLALALVAVRSRYPSPANARELKGRWPSALIQLPIYNEALVAERLLECVAEIRYPGLLEIQVLDDSDDETSLSVDHKVRQLVLKGLAIEVLRRPSRAGYKAGALAFGLKKSTAEVIAIFDADFLPPPDFLEQTVPLLCADPKRGMVQSCWGHANRSASMLTRAQAVLLDGHFAVEHQARSVLGHFFNFNGTAGVWRRQAIEDAGGWSADTITEDLDLSYRAQLAGWRFLYLGSLVTPAELPEHWGAFRAQQGRWVQGSVQTAKKLFRRVLFAPQIPLHQRFFALFHLSHNFAYLLMALLAALLPATVLVRGEMGWLVPGGQWVLSALDFGLLGAGTVAMTIFYSAAAYRTEHRFSLDRLRDILWALAIGAGLSLSNVGAVWRGITVKKAPFLRTPKRGDATSLALEKKYPSRAAPTVIVWELGFSIYFLVALVYALTTGLFGAVPFLLLYLTGFAAVGFGHYRELALRRGVLHGGRFSSETPETTHAFK